MHNLEFLDLLKSDHISCSLVYQVIPRVQQTNQVTSSFIFLPSAVLSQPKHNSKLETVFEKVICHFQGRIQIFCETLRIGCVFISLELRGFPFIIAACQNLLSTTGSLQP